MMKIIAGLGNPGLRYRNTRHNIGFKVLENVAKRHGCRIKKHGFKGIYAIARIEGEEVLLFEPLTYMNLSGEAIKAACSRHLDDMENLLVISDDVNLPLGSLRLRGSGSAGGHNGLRSVIGLMGEDFSRLRIGVGADYVPEDMAAYVLAGFTRREKAAVSTVIEKAADCAEVWAGKGLKEAMNVFNGA